MSHVPALHIRNVPEKVIATLKRRAKESGRSLNAEVVEALKDYDEQHTRTEELLRELDELRAEWLMPDDAPMPEDVIREEREERTREIDRRVRGL
jgi:plasmid stability protein